MSKPQLVLVPGAWHAPIHMATLTAKLEALGYKVHARQMPGVGSSNPPKDLSEDIAALQSLVEEAIGTGNDVIVICHSWGGTVTGSGLVGLSKQERAAEGKPGGVVRTGYMSAFMIPEGVSLSDAVGSDPPPWYDVQVCICIYALCYFSHQRSYNQSPHPALELTTPIQGTLHLRNGPCHLLQRHPCPGAAEVVLETPVSRAGYAARQSYGCDLEADPHVVSVV
jgi:pimeloyl-ACP methyl ester carboxylesterase